MMITIAAEQFTLTPAIRAHVEGNLSKLKDLLPNSSKINVFLSEPAPGLFAVLLKTRIFGKDMVVHETDEDFYKAVETARVHFTRKIVEEKKRWIRLRRQDPHLETLLTSDEASLSITP